MDRITLTQAYERDGVVYGPGVIALDSDAARKVAQVAEREGNTEPAPVEEVEESAEAAAPAAPEAAEEREAAPASVAVEVPATAAPQPKPKRR